MKLLLVGVGVNSKRTILKRILKILSYTGGVILALLIAIVLLVNLTPVQEYLAQKVAAQLSGSLKTKVSVAHVRIDFLNHFLVQGLYIADQSNDTLVYAGEAQIRISDWFIFKKKPVLHYLALRNTFVHLYRTAHSNAWNYDFLTDTSGEEKPRKAGKPFELNLEKLALDNVRFHMDDAWGGEDIDVDAGLLNINARSLDLIRNRLDVDRIDVAGSLVTVHEYTPGRPKRTHTRDDDTVDTTPFNADKWLIKATALSLKNCGFRLINDTGKPAPDAFDADHLDISNINVSATGLSIVGDTVRGHVESMNANERCGLAIRNMRSDVSVSPVASICSNLYLETNYSKVKNYYAMQYRRFPNFLDYIDSVVMVAHLRDAIVDERDIAYFAPLLRKFPQVVLHASGDGRGTVADLSVQHLDVTDGISTLKGNGSMKGLPDIYKTWITFTDGEIVTNGEGFLRYAGSLRNSPDVAPELVTSAVFKGSYEGYIEDFSVSGVLSTNLGTIVTRFKMDMPGFNSNTVKYSGTVSADQFQLGTLLRQPLLGGISLNENFSGVSFNPSMVQCSLDGVISELQLKGYDYHNIQTNGTIAKKQFDGRLEIDDPNLALDFNGSFNYMDSNVNVKAVAHLGYCNFNALLLTTDSLTGSADFDLNCTGSNIDNFSGYAKLYHIDTKRKGHRLALDSVFVNVADNGTNKELSIQSNDVSADIKGHYQLSQLPASVQYYLSRYLPNYIKAPAAMPPGQDFEFSVATENIDSVFAFAYPLLRGFDHATVKGGLHTGAHKLTLDANVLYGSIGSFRMSAVTVSAQGDLNHLDISAQSENVAVGDSSFSGSLAVTTVIGGDSVAFTVATTTADTSEVITLNGDILARKDSLFLSLRPSEFYLNQTKWDIAGGSRVVYADHYLDVNNLSLSSGPQRITANSVIQGKNKSLVISMENLDLAQLGGVAGLSSYQPDGRINGTVKLDDIFDYLHVNANVRASGVTLGADTLGSVNLVGEYDGSRKLYLIDPETGIYRDNSSIVASGTISFDTAVHQQLDGVIQFNDARVAWASPFLTGIFSHMTGVLNGSLNFRGTPFEPVLDGSLKLRDAGMRVDYIGCNYTIPSATIHVDNRTISFGKVLVYDSYRNPAALTGHFSHNIFRDMHMHLSMTSDKFEVMNLSSTDNNLFYGNIIAGVDSFTIRGPFNNIDMSIYHAYPAAKSKFYLPVSSGGDLNPYSYVTFKTYGKNQEVKLKRNKYKLSINLDASLTPLAEMHIVLDPSSGDEIMARGDGRISMEFPPNNDISIRGLYTIDNGIYSYTFKQLRFTRIFKLNSGSTISFNGPFAETALDVDAVYTTKARLADLLSDAEKAALTGTSDMTDAETPQMVDVILHMTGPIFRPKLTYDLDLEDKHLQSTVAYSTLKIVNADDQQKIEEVASLLLISSFIPPEGIVSSAAAQSGLYNNVGSVVSGTISSQLNNVINKLTGNRQWNVDVKYENYNYSDLTFGALNRNQVSVGVNKNFLNDRLGLEVGGTSDWGKPTSASPSSAFNFAGDFKIQYLLSYASGLRLNAFRTSDYDVTLDRDIQRSGVGLSWRKSFDNFYDFFHSARAKSRDTAKAESRAPLPAADTLQSLND